ncbi:nickel pincer cofactor biosynthesis protein LarC [Anaerocolumna sedimenticola]|uniref:Pyridinium-3,5-bisthiocarboxylic acid mononucleotide nickel insertion protein n=1 Tax=Anaerocolumna sedimenticola TaxID=2696063 RepID=A0A6P1TN78_9FIRM|nr:nickel pincer cofactor biosynthesis protein LarC [Anaerocolumna sedimenticola]QHQ61135.1 nickel pincer cofactor biosynthesis protein LarC [Anaerocolumna sedimenticola]
MDKKTLYLECYSGISGDMTVASLIDLGADVEVLTAGLNSLNVDGYKIEISRKAINSIDACDFHVILDVPEANYETEDNKHTGTSASHETHNHEYLHEHNIEHSHEHNAEHSHEHIPEHSHEHTEHSHEHTEHSHEHIPEHSHEHSNGHKHVHLHARLKRPEGMHIHSHSHEGEHPHIHYGHHEHRNLNDINAIIDGSAITDNAKQIAKRIFYIVAVAESKAHGKPIEEVHFHEVGAVDSIVDIVAVSICLDNLNIGDVIVSELYEGTGHINCQHGILPVPVPAVVNIVTEHHLSLHITSIKGELVTPTGAAIAAAIRTKEVLPKEFKISKIGLGAGKRNYERTSFLRAMLIEDTTGNSSFDTVPDKVWVLEANIDDCSGEAMSIALETLLQNGAKDAYYTPIFMKKNRPAYLLGVICSENKVAEMEEIIFTHTTTIGIRKQEALRTTLNREIIPIITPYGEALVKVCTYHDKTFYYPECDSIKKLCNKSGKDYITLYSLVQTLASQG